MADEAVLAKFTNVQVLRGAGPIRSYRALTADGVDVCVKSIDYDANSSAAALRAMATLQSVQSPNLARIVDSGATDTGYYFAREWIQGTHLGTKPLPETLPPKKAALALADGLGGLTAVHAAGLVCGDLKPTSFVVGADGVTRLVDAVLPPTRVREDAASPEVAYYTSPEELQPAGPTQRTDIYRAGLVLYEVLAGRPPFTGPDAATVVSGHRSGTPLPPSTVNPKAPKGLDAVVARALSKDATMRYESAGAMKQAIEAETRTAIPWLWIGLAALGVLLLLGGGLWLLTHQAPTAPAAAAVPGIVGKTQSAAEASITAAGLKIGKVSEQATTGAAPGTVISQTPPPGTSVSPSSSVDYAVAELPVVKVPDCVGASESDAVGRLGVDGLRVGTITYATDPKVKAGYVITQAPSSGTQVPIGSAVALTVSEGPQAGLVPNVVGLSEDDAVATIEGAGFKTTTTKATSTSIPAGNVIQQSPAAGAAATAGSSVTITVSTGAPQAPKVTVPNVVGMSPRDARKALLDLKLHVGWAFVSATSQEMVLKVQQQDPAATAQVSAGTKVTLTIGLPSFSFEANPAPAQQPAPTPGPAPATTVAPAPQPAPQPAPKPTIPGTATVTTP